MPLSMLHSEHKKHDWFGIARPMRSSISLALVLCVELGSICPTWPHPSSTSILGAQMPEEVKLEFIKEIGFCHMRILDGLDTLLQLSGMIAKLCCVAANAGAKPPAAKK